MNSHLLSFTLAWCLLQSVLGSLDVVRFALAWTHTVDWSKEGCRILSKMHPRYKWKVQSWWLSWRLTGFNVFTWFNWFPINSKRGCQFQPRMHLYNSVKKCVFASDTKSVDDVDVVLAWNAWFCSVLNLMVWISCCEMLLQNITFINSMMWHFVLMKLINYGSFDFRILIDDLYM